MTRAERERLAVAEHDCPLTWSCRARPGEPCTRRTGPAWLMRQLKHPHAGRVALVREATA